MELRVNAISNFTRRMADIRIAHHPLRTKVDLIFNYVKRDVYQDSSLEEEARVEKLCILRKNPDLLYVQDLFMDELVEDTDQLPWTMLITTTGLPRLPKNDDQIVLRELVNYEVKVNLYTISAVKPINRNRPVVLECLIYPERTPSYDGDI